MDQQHSIKIGFRADTMVQAGFDINVSGVVFFFLQEFLIFALLSRFL